MDNDSSSANAFLKQMHDLQQMYFRNMEQVFSAYRPEKSAANLFEQWWQQMSGMSKPLAGNLPGAGMDSNQVQEWVQGMSSQFKQWFDSSQASNPLFKHINDQFKQQLMMPWGANFLNPGQNPAELFNLGQHLNSPIINLLQQLFDQEERLVGQQLLDSLEQYQKVMMQYNHLMSSVGLDSLKQIQQMVKEAEAVDLENVTQHWMELSQEMLQQDKYLELANDLEQKLKSLQAQLTEDYEKYRATLIKQLGLASSSEVEELRQQLNQLKKQIK